MITENYLFEKGETDLVLLFYLPIPSQHLNLMGGKGGKYICKAINKVKANKQF